VSAQLLENHPLLKPKTMKKVIIILAVALATVTVLTSCSDKKVTKDTFVGKWECTSFQHQAVNSDEWVEELSADDPVQTYIFSADGTYQDIWYGVTETLNWDYDESTGLLNFDHQVWTVESYKKKELVLYSDTWAQSFGQKHRMTLMRVK
jgi:hypothetical protein